VDERLAALALLLEASAVTQRLQVLQKQSVHLDLLVRLKDPSLLLSGASLLLLLLLMFFVLRGDCLVLRAQVHPVEHVQVLGINGVLFVWLTQILLLMAGGLLFGEIRFAGFVRIVVVLLGQLGQVSLDCHLIIALFLSPQISRQVLIVPLHRFAQSVRGESLVLLLLVLNIIGSTTILVVLLSLMRRISLIRNHLVIDH